METLVQDLRYGIRTLIKSPGFAVVSTATLALAIAVNTAIFSLVNAIVFADLPMEEPATVTIFRGTNVQLNVEYGRFSLPEYLDYREHNRSFEGLAAWTADRWILTGAEEPIRVDGYRVTDNFLDVWRIGTVAGRKFLPEETTPGAPPVAMLSHGFWTRHFGARPDVIGSTIRLDGREHTIIGVLSPKLEFANLAEAELWLPLNWVRSDATRAERNVSVTGRLLPGVTVAQAQRDVAAIASRLADEYPATNRGWEPLVLTAMDSLLNDDSKTILLLLVITVGFVLLIACANVANMLLARSTARSREMAVRAALGARRIRLIRQLLTESFVIAVAAAATGLAMSRSLMWVLVWITQERERAFQMAVLDGNVLAFTLIVSLIAPLAFGLTPALRTSKEDVSESLKQGSLRTGAGRSGQRTRSFLVTAQVSLALMLMVVAGLLVRSVINLEQRELGFEPAGVLTMRITLPETKYETDEQRRQFFRDVTGRLATLPAVQATALTTERPAVSSGPNQAFAIAGRSYADDLERPTARSVTVDPSFLSLMRIPIIRGRGFTAQDTEESFPVALVSQEAARRYWANEDPVGQRIRIGEDDAAPWVQIVGVVADVRSNQDIERPDPQIYSPFAQEPRSAMLVMVRSLGNSEMLIEPVRREVWAVDPDQPIDDVRAMEQALYDSESSRYALLTLFVAFAVFALLMAAIGIYGVMSYAVSQRTGEISLRMALGAKTGHVRKMVLGQGVKLIGIGAAVGLLGAVLIAQLLSSLVFGISRLDPVTFVGVPAVLAFVGLLANYLPALRATRIDPMSALRVE
jgi:putative ABC transport system permease protein